MPSISPTMLLHPAPQINPPVVLLYPAKVLGDEDGDVGLLAICYMPLECHDTAARCYEQALHLKESSAPKFCLIREIELPSEKEL